MTTYEAIVWPQITALYLRVTADNPTCKAQYIIENEKRCRDGRPKKIKHAGRLRSKISLYRAYLWFIAFVYPHHPYLESLLTL